MKTENNKKEEDSFSCGNRMKRDKCCRCCQQFGVHNTSEVLLQLALALFLRFHFRVKYECMFGLFVCQVHFKNIKMPMSGSKQSETGLPLNVSEVVMM